MPQRYTIQAGIAQTHASTAALRDAGSQRRPNSVVSTAVPMVCMVITMAMVSVVSGVCGGAVRLPACANDVALLLMCFHSVIINADELPRIVFRARLVAAAGFVFTAHVVFHAARR